MIKLAILFTVNTSDEPLRKKTKRSSNFFYEIAPGERKKLNDWIREENHDTKAFPELFPDGKNGLHDKSRKRKISPIQNYSHKILNKNKKFSKDPDFVFVAQQYLEKHSFENQISISLQRGVLTNTLEGGKDIKSHNAIDVLMFSRSSLELLPIGKGIEMRFLLEWSSLVLSNSSSPFHQLKCIGQKLQQQSFTQLERQFPMKKVGRKMIPRSKLMGLVFQSTKRKNGGIEAKLTRTTFY